MGVPRPPGGTRVVALLRKDRRQTVAPDLFHGREDSRLVIDHDVALRGIVTLHILEHAFLVNVDQHAALDRIP
jgi:hypothetical protein